jgi:phage/plasmid-like protein (TIGR03299 family)
MPANLAIKANGEAALWLNGQPAWHKLGKVWTEADGPIDLDSLMTESGLGFLVEKRPLFWGSDVESKMGTDLVTEGQTWATVKVQQGQPDVQLGTVGNVYEPFQNRDAFSFLFDMTGQGVATVETAGMLAAGARVFVTVRLGDDLVLDPGGSADKIRKYLFVSSSHNGYAKLTGGITPTRIVCANTYSVALSNASLRWEIRHTKGGLDRMQAAARTVAHAQAYYEELEQVGTQLLQARMTNAQFHKFVAQTFPIDEKAPEFAQQRIRKMHEQMIYLFEEAETQANIRNTRWAAAQAVTEHLDHFADVRVPKSLRLDAGTPADLAKEIARGARIVKGDDEAKKSEIHKKLFTWKR